jgi:hypothetical protein
MKSIAKGVGYLLIVLFSVGGLSTGGTSFGRSELEEPGEGGKKRCCQGGGTAKICNVDCGWLNPACQQTMQCN